MTKKQKETTSFRGEFLKTFWNPFTYLCKLENKTHPEKIEELIKKELKKKKLI